MTTTTHRAANMTAIQEAVAGAVTRDNVTTVPMREVTYSADGVLSFTTDSGAAVALTLNNDTALFDWCDIDSVNLDVTEFRRFLNHNAGKPMHLMFVYDGITEGHLNVVVDDVEGFYSISLI